MSRLKPLAAVLVSVALCGVTAACGSGDTADATNPSSTSAAGGSDDSGLVALPTKKIGLIVASLQSESLARFAENTKAAAKVLRWTAEVVDGQSNPQVWASGTQQLVAQHVDAIITMAIDAPAITQPLQAAKSAGIPVIAADVSVAPTGKELFTAVYSDDDKALGAALADYAVEKSPGAKAVGQTATAVYAADLLVQSAKGELEAKEGSMEEIQDIDVTNLAPSFGETAVSLTQGNADAEYLISCCDFAPAIDLPALQQAGQDDITLMTRYDNASSLKYMADGANLVVVAANTERTNLQALDVLAAYFANETPIPATYPNDDFQFQVIDASSMPADGKTVFPFDEMLASFTDRWQSTYAIR
jgi:ribose transport system substrate-binding protein